MRNIFVLISVFVLFSVALSAGPANKVTGDMIRQWADRPSSVWSLFLSVHEAVEMKNGKTRPAKGIVTSHRISDPGDYWMAEILCVNVADESNAYFAAVIRASSFTPMAVGSFMKFWAIDRGEPGAWADDIWTQNRILDEGEATAICSDPEGNLPAKLWYVIDGNLQVHYQD